MSNIAIKAEHLSKMYRIRTENSPKYSTLREQLSNGVKSLWGGGEKQPPDKLREFWAIDDVSFEIKEGDRVGVIGRNGAGKSTLLKLLSKIIVPTRGQAMVRGRLASLLEVGTGFHPELTGRENIYLNGALLGMARSHINKVFDEVVDFANIASYLDTPVKRYSSGMYTRLAFAVAAHLEPDILIIDEVLAVGDAAFQHKCIDRMQRMNGEGRTVIIVSHNMALVSSLCISAMVLEHGHVHTPLSLASNAIANYNELLFTGSMDTLATRVDRGGTGNIIFTDAQCGSTEQSTDASIFTGKELYTRLVLKAVIPTSRDSGVHIAVAIVNEWGHCISINSTINEGHLHRMKDGVCETVLKLPHFRFGPGGYTINIAAMSEDGTLLDWLQNAAFFRCELGDFFKNGSQVPAGHMCAIPENEWLEMR